MAVGDEPFRTVTPPARARLSDAIAQHIESLVAHGTLGPGSALPAERLLAAKLGVSRPSLREALLRLEARGLLRVARGGGFVVTDVTAPTLTDPLVHLLNAHSAAELDVLELRHALELSAAYLAAQRATPQEKATLKAAYELLARPDAHQDALLEAQADAEFHLALAEASHNVALIHVMHGLHNLLRTTMRHAWEVMREDNDNKRVLMQQHRALLDAVLAGDAPRARDAAHLHLNYVRQTLILARQSPPAKATANPATKPARGVKVAAAPMGGVTPLKSPRKTRASTSGGEGGPATATPPARKRAAKTRPKPPRS